MIEEEFVRTAMLIGPKNMDRLAAASVAIFGIGGVGSFVSEALARTGIGRFDLIDKDTICASNINRQIHATRETIGRFKVDEMKERILSVNPRAEVRTHRTFFLPDTAGDFDFTLFDYVIDAVDTVTAKIEIILRAQRAGVPVISCMGTGNKLDPGQLKIADIYQTSICPLARVMRKELKKRGVRHLKVLYSTEKPLTPRQDLAELFPDQKEASTRRSTPGSIAFTPSVAGLLIAGEVVRDLIEL